MKDEIVIYQPNERYINILKQEICDNKRDKSKNQRLMKYLKDEENNNKDFLQ